MTSTKNPAAKGGDSAETYGEEPEGTRYTVTVVVFDDDVKALEDILVDNDFEYSIEARKR